MAKKEEKKAERERGLVEKCAHSAQRLPPNSLSSATQTLEVFLQRRNTERKMHRFGPAPPT